MSAQNLVYLEKNWLVGSTAKNALASFRRWQPAERKWILRHHDEKEIEDDETCMRDEFDYLLSFYGIVEIAATIGFVNSFPTAFRKNHLPVLCDPSARRYYELNYHLSLPSKLRERLQTDYGFSAPSHAEVNSLFYEFLELTKLIERDEDLESFLWVLDGGSRGGCDFQLVKKSLQKPRLLFDAVQQRNDKKTELEHALCGFCKFILFCEGFAKLLNRMEKFPVAAEAMWMAHDYWFRQLGYRIGTNLRKAFKSLALWENGVKGKKAVSKRARELEAVFQQLSVPPMTRWKIGFGRPALASQDTEPAKSSPSTESMNILSESASASVDLSKDESMILGYLEAPPERDIKLIQVQTGVTQKKIRTFLKKLTVSSHAAPFAAEQKALIKSRAAGG